MRLPDPPILVITDRKQCREPLETRAEALFRGGCRWISVRENDLSPAERLALLRRLGAIGGDFGAMVGVHRDQQAARACGAALHLPAQAQSSKARRGLGQGVLIGQSCHCQDDLARAAAVDYVTLSPVFQSASKPGYGPALACAGLRLLTAATRIPVLALGGVTLDTICGLDGTGISGVAVMGGAMSAIDPTNWFAALTTAWRALRCPSPASDSG